MFNENHYVPVLKAKRGEFQALKELEDAKKAKMTPLFEIIPIPWDYEADGFLKTIDKHLEKVIDNIFNNWGERPFFLDLKFLDPNEKMAEGVYPLACLSKQAKEKELNLIPVTGVNKDDIFQESVLSSIEILKCGVCIRLESEDFDDEDLPDKIEGLVENLGVTKDDVDIVIDFGAIPESNLTPFVVGVRNIIRYMLPTVQEWRTLTLISSSFPQNLSMLNSDDIGYIKRSDWLMWQLIADSERIKRIPTFGDYTSIHPVPFEMNPRMMHLGAKIKYTAEDDWIIIKGIGVKRGGYEQFYRLARKVTMLDEYCGKDFSWGDEYIYECAHKKCGTGNQTTWVKVSVNHHIVFAINQISNYFSF